MEEVDSRFLHLLQPIRDLTKNWEVDVAAQLGEYLEELDQICISFDNGKTTMNFMEAALLIQGSACIYSRKVEYLYMLVCQTLDCISKKKKEKLPSSLGPDGRDADATFTDREEEFLSLDDIPETSQASVNMRGDQQPAAVNIVPLTPMSLVPPEEGEKKENPLLSRRGEVLASRRDFRMNTSTPHACGAFLLELGGRPVSSPLAPALLQSPVGLSLSPPLLALSRVPCPAPARVPQPKHTILLGSVEEQEDPGCAGPSRPVPCCWEGRAVAGPARGWPRGRWGQWGQGTGACLSRSRRGEVLASRRDFRMNTSTPHACGAFLLELAGLSPTHPRQEPGLGTATAAPASSPAQRPGSGTALARALSFCEEAGEGWHLPALSWGPRGHPGHLALAGELLGRFLGRQGGNGGSWKLLQPLPIATPPGAEGPEDDDLPAVLEDDMEVTPVPNEHIVAQRVCVGLGGAVLLPWIPPAPHVPLCVPQSTPRTRGYVLRERPPSQDPKALSKEEPNPWQSLDPFGDSEEKPFRKGRPFQVPHGLDDVIGGKRKRRGPRKLQDFTRWFSAAYNNVTESRKSRRNGPTFADLEVLYWRHFKERMAAHRKLRSRGVSGVGAKLGGQGAPGPPCRALGVLRAVPPPRCCRGSWSQSWSRSAGLTARMGQVLEPKTPNPPCLGSLSFPPGGLGESQKVGGSQGALRGSQGTLSGVPILADDDFVEHEDMEPEAPPEELEERNLDSPEPGYEELVRRNVELFMASSQKFAQETELSQRIRQWEERVEPLLQEQEGRAPFDVRAYGQQLTGRCAELGQWHSLASLVAGQPPFEVCRYLLASLQLANDEEVELEQEPGLEAALDTARLRLLSARPAHERFQHLQLPSQRDPGPQ
ncbi:condensin-2 complex subunit H2 [Passer montanus]|uniref:condensin-2 complex subunit H2 n=1 Tax=Passer montanus TaxID=9160 RepID=UPI001960EDE7|nr:condensin-2 complex subunit H2 [Passer montanus]